MRKYQRCNKHNKFTERLNNCINDWLVLLGMFLWFRHQHLLYQCIPPTAHCGCDNRKLAFPVTQTNQWIIGESIISFLWINAFKTTE